MAKHKSLKDAIREKEFRRMIEESLKKQFQRGLLIGSRSILKAVGDKIAEEGKSPEEKLLEVMKMVNNLLGMTDKTEADEMKAIENPMDELMAGEDAAEEAGESADEEEVPEGEPEVVKLPVPAEDDDE